MRKSAIDITNKTFGRLTALRKIGNTKGGGIIWECICLCGEKTAVLGKCLRNGTTQSCGCYNREQASKKNTKHGLSCNPLYFVWYDMINRCTNIRAVGYNNYGGRGIKVCERWLDINNFIEDTSKGYKKGLELDRFPNNNGHYEQNNFRWATRKENSNNRRTNRIIEYKGESLKVTELCEKYKLKITSLTHRLNSGWGIEDCVSMPIDRNNNKVKDKNGRYVRKIS